MSVIKFPGTQETDEDITVDKVLEAVKEYGLAEIFVVGIKDTGEVIVSGNCTMANGVYLAEIGKNMIIQETRSE